MAHERGGLPKTGVGSTPHRDPHRRQRPRHPTTVPPDTPTHIRWALRVVGSMVILPFPGRVHVRLARRLRLQQAFPGQAQPGLLCHLGLSPAAHPQYQAPLLQAAPAHAPQPGTPPQALAQAGPPPEVTVVADKDARLDAMMADML
jgi:hypothetical protein